MLFVLCRRFLDPSDVFSTHFTPLQSLRVATSSAKGCYVLRSATPEGTPAFAPDSTALRSRLHDPSLLSFRFVRSEKSFGIQKTSAENE